MSPLFDLGGTIALVTGSSQGIGLALAEGLAAHGARIVINGRDKAKIASAVANLKAKGHDAYGAAFDVTSKQVADDIDRVERDIGFRVQGVSLDEFDAEPLRNRVADEALAAARDAHDHIGHWFRDRL